MAREEEVASQATSQPSPLGMIAENEFEGKIAGEMMRNGLGMQLCWIPEGKFIMGSPANEDGHNPNQEKQVEVNLTSGFWMGKYEVTKGDYKKLMGSSPSSFGALGEKGPVEKVSWIEAVAFCEALTEREQNKLPEG